MSHSEFVHLVAGSGRVEAVERRAQGVEGGCADGPGLPICPNAHLGVH